MRPRRASCGNARPLNSGVMPLARRLLAALAATGAAVCVAFIFVHLDEISDATGGADDAYAKGAAASPLLIAALFIFYLAVANLKPLWSRHPYLSAAVVVVGAVSVLIAIPGVVWVVAAGAPPLAPSTYGPMGAAMLMGVSWLMLGALLQVPTLKRHNYRLDRTGG